MKALSVLCTLLLVASAVPAQAVANDPNDPPLVDAGLDQSVDSGAVVYLDGGGTVDPDGTVTDFRWTVETPDGDLFRPTNGTRSLARFDAGAPGRYTVTLTATDDGGLARSDTLYVDVGTDPAPAPSAPSPPARSNPTGSPAASPSSGGGTTGDEGGTGTGGSNAPPTATITGPSTVQQGETHTFDVVASDPDGRVTRVYWPLQAGGFGGASGAADDRSASYTFDEAPGSNVSIPVVVTDDAGATTTVSKTVQVEAPPPTVFIEGPDVVEAGSTQTYSTTVYGLKSDSIRYFWNTNSNQDLRLNAHFGHAESSSIAFDNPGSQTVSVSVFRKGEFVSTATKRVKVVNSETDTKPSVVSFSGHVIDEGSSMLTKEESVFGEYLPAKARIRFKITAIDSDADQMQVIWKFGENGYAKTEINSKSNSSISTYQFDERKTGLFEEQVENVEVTVVDEDGHKVSRVNSLTITSVPNGGSSRISISTDSDVYHSGQEVNIDITSQITGDYHHIFVGFGDGTTKQIPLTTCNRGGLIDNCDKEVTKSIVHRYDNPGNYTIHVKPIIGVDGAGGLSTGDRQTIEVRKNTYEEWHYNHYRISQLHRLSRKEPVDGIWEKSSIEQYESIIVDTKISRVPISSTNVVSGLTPGDGWQRTGVDTETETLTTTREATSSPGDDWRLAEANVDTERVFTGWQQTTVDSRYLRQSGWRFVETVRDTVTRRVTRESTDRPAGSGWTRGAYTGRNARDGTDYVWIDSTWYAGADWRYVRSRTRTVGWETSEHCHEYVRFFSRPVCIDEHTHRERETDTEYLYAKPNYERLYEWSRTVRRTDYDYRYEYRTFRTVPVHRYERTTTVERRYAVWEKHTYGRVPVYNWTRTTDVVEPAVSLDRPTEPNVVGEPELHTHHCGDGDGELADRACGNGSHNGHGESDGGTRYGYD